MAIRNCDICGKEEDERWMVSFNPGARRLYFCWECYRNAQKQVASSEFMRKTRREKIAENKKVKK